MKLLLKIHSDKTTINQPTTSTTTTTTTTAATTNRYQYKREYNKTLGRIHRNSQEDDEFCMEKFSHLFILFIIATGIIGIAIYIILNPIKYDVTTSSRKILLKNDNVRNDVRILPYRSDRYEVKSRTERHVAKNLISNVMIINLRVESVSCRFVNVTNYLLEMRTLANERLDCMEVNFYIDDDGYVYLRNGWRNNDQLLIIGIMSNILNELQLDRIKDLLVFGIKKLYIVSDYKFINSKKIEHSYIKQPWW